MQGTPPGNSGAALDSGKRIAEFHQQLLKQFGLFSPVHPRQYFV